MPRKPRFLVVGVANYVIKGTDPLNSIGFLGMGLLYRKGGEKKSDLTPFLCKFKLMSNDVPGGILVDFDGPRNYGNDFNSSITRTEATHYYYHGKKIIGVKR